MEWTGLNELREMFLSFYESKMHTRLPSFPLIPRDDNSLLLINSGMAPMKKFFLGTATPPNTRVTTCQKCIRTPDIENVGHTARHGTFFEMLGNFSFGDYFKHEATKWAWEFVTQVVKLPEDRVYITIYQDDDEAFDIWTKEVGIDPSHIVRMGKEDNFWEIGSGPCGPCSELYFDRGEKYGCGSPDCGVGCECDRFIEFWNLVFSQFDSDGKGGYTPLEHPNIDTGMGLERLACIMQDVDNLFEVDTVQNIMKHISRIAGVNYHEDETNDISLRVITDHIRSTVFMVSDGVIPSNEGRGYVLRRLLRRAARHGRLLGIERPFLCEVCDTVINENKKAYPELVENEAYIKKVIEAEEERFSKTIDQGLLLLEDLISEMQDKNESVLSGENCFKLYDTFGFPIDLTLEILEEKGLKADEDKFRELMDEQRVRARSARSKQDTISWADDVLSEFKDVKQGFDGYDKTNSEGKVLAIVVDGEKKDKIQKGENATLILDNTCFYAESGGQVGDTGYIETKLGKFRVTSTTKSAAGIFKHDGFMEDGEIVVTDRVNAIVDAARRNAITRNHSACHVLQAALREVLGDHVHQAGSYVDENRCRFDFSHFSAVSEDELKRVEAICNKNILAGVSVSKKEMPIEEAKKLGAMALFGEKYGDVVRVVDMEGVSTEFCGGCHVDNTSQIGLFRIISESSVAAGIRRIEATTGYGVLELLDESENELASCAKALKAPTAKDAVQKAEQTANELKALQKELEELKQELNKFKAEEMFKDIKDLGKVRLLVSSLPASEQGSMRGLGDKLRSENDDLVAIIYCQGEKKTSINVSCGKKAIEEGVGAGRLIKELGKLCDGNGGGKDQSAMGGCGDVAKLSSALEKAPELVLSMIK